jgi:hypothetical protein
MLSSSRVQDRSCGSQTAAAAAAGPPAVVPSGRPNKRVRAGARTGAARLGPGACSITPAPRSVLRICSAEVTPCWLLRGMTSDDHHMTIR